MNIKKTVLYFGLISFLISSCSKKEIEKCALKKFEIHEKCNKEKYWSGVNVKYYLTTDSAGFDSEKVNALIMDEYNKTFSEITNYKLQDIDQLIKYSNSNNCFEGFNFYGIVEENKNGLLKLSFETYYIENPDVKSSKVGHSGSLTIDLNKSKITHPNTK